MVVVNSTEDTHRPKVVPRFAPSSIVVLELYNETTREVSTPSNLYLYIDGIMTFTFNFTFDEDSKYQMKVTEDGNVVFRGKLIAINQDAQNYDPSQGLYTYSTI